MPPRDGGGEGASGGGGGRRRPKRGRPPLPKHLPSSNSSRSARRRPPWGAVPAARAQCRRAAPRLRPAAARREGRGRQGARPHGEAARRRRRGCRAVTLPSAQRSPLRRTRCTAPAASCAARVGRAAPGERGRRRQRHCDHNARRTPPPGPPLAVDSRAAGSAGAHTRQPGDAAGCRKVSEQAKPALGRMMSPRPAAAPCCSRDGRPGRRRQMRMHGGIE